MWRQKDRPKGSESRNSSGLFKVNKANVTTSTNRPPEVERNGLSSWLTWFSVKKSTHCGEPRMERLSLTVHDGHCAMHIYWAVKKLHFSNISSPNEHLTLLSIPDLRHCRDNKAHVYTGLYSDPFPTMFLLVCVCFTSRFFPFFKITCLLFILCIM